MFIAVNKKQCLLALDVLKLVKDDQVSQRCPHQHIKCK